MLPVTMPFAPTLSSIASCKIIAFGNINASLPLVQQVLDHEFPEGNGVALATGDLKIYEPLTNGHHLYFVHGTLDQSIALATLRSGESPAAKSLHPILAGEIVEIGGLRIAGLPGIFDREYYNRLVNIPVQYFTQTAVRNLIDLQKPVDILLTHVSPAQGRFPDVEHAAGKHIVSGILELLRPQLCLSGHDQLSWVREYDTTHAIGLRLASQSYVAIHFDDLSNTIDVTEHATADILNGETTRGRLITSHKRTSRIPEEITAEWNGRFRKQVVAALATYMAGRPQHLQTSERSPLALQALADVATGSAMTYAARFAAALEANPDLSKPEREVLMQHIVSEMQQTFPNPDIATELPIAFQTILTAASISV